MRIAGTILALFVLTGAASPAPGAAPQPAPSADVTVDADPTSVVKTFTLQTTYTGATYGPGNFIVTQIFPRLTTLRIGQSLARLSLPRVQTINGVDSGISDAQIVYLAKGQTRAGGMFVGVSAQLPTANSRLFGTGKWMIGPAAAYIFAFKPKVEIAGVLLQSAFSVAGDGSRRSQSAITLLPFASFWIGHGWYLKLPEAPWIFDLERGASVIPLGLGIGRQMAVGGAPVLLAVSDETTVLRANVVNAPKNTVRLTLTVLLSGAPPR